VRRSDRRLISLDRLHLLAQETTENFGHRLKQAVEVNPHAPASVHGRQSWLRDRLRKEKGITVSANTVHKWMNGASMPRGDNLRAVSEVLEVDEVWLTLGRKPVEKTVSAAAQATGSAKATILAGLIEAAGGRVTFNLSSDSPEDLSVNIDGEHMKIIVAAPQRDKKNVSFILPALPSDARVIAVFLRRGDDYASAVIDLFDLTDVERKMFGGFSVLEAEERPGRKLRVPGQRNLLSPVSCVRDLLPVA